MSAFFNLEVEFGRILPKREKGKIIQTLGQVSFKRHFDQFGAIIITFQLDYQNQPKATFFVVILLLTLKLMSLLLPLIAQLSIQAQSLQSFSHSTPSLATP
ncbi:hypothetical protein FGO68_gene12614 [Halteria grandinella]|uniref:Uncharacterized protein n=1 Tax=Halteria grandinella TaxID=5974 RepID=A0A8J8T6V6_HALGN|nr:hypothetical protein FGO68_gene12614 [Halteria grandinella]